MKVALAVIAAIGTVALGPGHGRVHGVDRIDLHRAPTPERPTLRSRISRLERSTAGGGRQRQVVIGRSALGRPIEIRTYGSGPPYALVFGCIHGTECAASNIHTFAVTGCPTPGAILFVPNLNPDGLAVGTRLNGRGVDLNRNFPAGWRPIGQRWDPEYSGPHPFSEPETRLAAKLIGIVHPDVTVWFHQQEVPMVRAWGPSVPAARRYSRYSGLPFRRLPWPAGTAPNWQNHRFPETSSFVVELPPGPLSAEDRRRFAAAVAEL